MSRPWALVLTRPNGAAARRVGGLPLALRLALDAARAGAEAIVCGDACGVPPTLLADERLQIPVAPEPPPDTARVNVAASLLCHRELLRTAAATARVEGEVTVAAGTPPPPGMPYAFPVIDVVDPRAAARAERALFRSLRKPEDGWTSRWLNRYVSLTISRWLVKTPLRPNQVSVGILFVGVLGAWLASRGGYGMQLWGALFFQAQSILDGCDGEMSRVTHRGSLLGEWLDTIGDDITNYGFFAGASLGLHQTTGSFLYLGAGALTVGAGLTTSLIEYRYLARIGSGDLLKYPTSRAASEGTGALSAVAPLFKRDTFVLLTLVAAVLDVLGPMLVVFSLAAAGILANVLATEARMRRSSRGAERAERNGGDAPWPPPPPPG